MRIENFKSRMANRDMMAGTFLKTPAYELVEVLATITWVPTHRITWQHSVTTSNRTGSMSSIGLQKHPAILSQGLTILILLVTAIPMSGLSWGFKTSVCNIHSTAGNWKNSKWVVCGFICLQRTRWYSATGWDWILKMPGQSVFRILCSEHSTSEQTLISKRI